MKKKLLRILVGLICFAAGGAIIGWNIEEDGKSSSGYLRGYCINQTPWEKYSNSTLLCEFGYREDLDSWVEFSGGSGSSERKVSYPQVEESNNNWKKQLASNRAMGAAFLGGGLFVGLLALYFLYLGARTVLAATKGHLRKRKEIRELKAETERLELLARRAVAQDKLAKKNVISDG